MPEKMRRSWVKWSFDVLKRSNQQAEFNQLVEFVRYGSNEVNSLYGKSCLLSSKIHQLCPGQIGGSVQHNIVETKM